MAAAELERLDEFMARANAAYYASQDPFADFVTAPEISQAFGEILGLWAGVVWQSMGAPNPVVLAEAGPGRGTLMQDALRAISRTLPDFSAALRLHLIEMSPRLRAAQAERFPDATWHESPDTIPAGPLLLLANEFFDALPIRQFVRRGNEWAERYVCNGVFTEHPRKQTGGGEIIEVGEVAVLVVMQLAARIADTGGAALLIDYGPAEPAAGDSLQAIRDGQPADPLAAIGKADLTAHVDFPVLAQAARAAGAAIHGPLPQGIFLTRLGLTQRSLALARSLPAAAAAAMMDGAQRLTQPDRMGRLFKAMAVCHPGLPTPPGFAA